MKYQMMIKSIAAAGMVLGSLNVMATGFGGAWSHDSNTGTLMNANAPSNTGNDPVVSMKSKKGSEFADGWSHDSNTGTLFNANAPSHEKQPGTSNDSKVTLNSFGGGWYQDSTGTLTYID